jgi:hypothetical protein
MLILGFDRSHLVLRVVPVLHVDQLEPTSLGQLHHRFGRVIEIIPPKIAHFVRGETSEVKADADLHDAVGFPEHLFNLRQRQIREDTMRVHFVEMGLGEKSIGRLAGRVNTSTVSSERMKNIAEVFNRVGSARTASSKP